jgi:hypothetical protein
VRFPEDEYGVKVRHVAVGMEIDLSTAVKKVNALTRALLLLEEVIEDLPPALRDGVKVEVVIPWKRQEEP